jgi:hypothetical protein
MEFLDHIKDDYMVPRKCVPQKLIDVCNGFSNILQYENPITYYDRLLNYYKVYYKSTFYWKEMADLDYELTKMNLKIDYDLDLSTYEIYNTKIFDKLKINIMSKHIILYFQISIIMDRLEIYTYDYDKISEEK